MERSLVENGIQEIILASWEEFEELNRTDFVDAQAYIYRGQADYGWPIQSALDRLEERYPTKPNLSGGTPPVFQCSPADRRLHLQAFKHAVRCKKGLIPSNEREWWALAQHHGLATPMLDWTMSPFVALYFAFEEERALLSSGEWGEPEFRAVFVLSSSRIDEKSEQGEATPKPFAPMEGTSPRLTAQNGLFLQMPKGTELENYVESAFVSDSPIPRGMEIDQYMESIGRGEAVRGSINPRAILTKVKIPNTGRHDCLKVLNKMNINRMTLFPDLDGAGRYINDLWGLGFDTSLGFFSDEP